MKLPANPKDLGPEWKVDPTHRYPNGTRYRDPSGRILDWHKGDPSKPRTEGGKDHWHDPDNFGRRHLKPGTEVPDPAPVPDPPSPAKYDAPAEPEQPPFCAEYPIICILPWLLPPLIDLPPIPIPVP